MIQRVLVNGCIERSTQTNVMFFMMGICEQHFVWAVLLGVMFFGTGIVPTLVTTHQIL